MTTTSTRRLALLILALIAAFLIGYLWVPAGSPAAYAAPTLRHADGGANVRQIGTWKQDHINIETRYLNRKRWNAPKVVAKIERRTGLDLRLNDCPEQTYLADGVPTYVNACLTVMSDRDMLDGKRRVLVQLWSAGSTLQAADVALDDGNTRKWSRAKRDRRLCIYLGRGVGLTPSQTKAACK